MSESLQGLGLTFRFDAENRILYANYAPDPQSSSIDAAWLQLKTAELGWGALRYAPDAVAGLLSKYNRGIAITDLALAGSTDATVEISLSPDELQATLNSEAAQGGLPLSQDRIFAELANKGITYGVLSEAITQAVAAGSAQNLLIAQGRAPVHGKNGWLEYLQPLMRDRTPKVDEFDHTDYRDLGDILVVHPGDLLMLRHAPTIGEAGITLRGANIAPIPGNDVHFASHLDGAEICAEDPNLLIATLSGQPVQVPDGMIVEPVFHVPAVNAASGNIRFEGSVVIKGDVQAGMRVVASGDIEVEGVVEAATLDAGGNILIKGGAMGGLGHHDGHFLRCGGSFSAGYASQARIEAGGSIFIDDSAIQCELIAVNAIRVGDKKKGHLIGGSAHASFNISAKVIGSPKMIVTKLEIGVNPIIHKQLKETIQSRVEKENQLCELSKVLEFGRQHPDKVNAATLDKVRSSATAAAASIAEIRHVQDALEQQIEVSHHSMVIAEQAFHEGVNVTLDGMHYTVSSPFGPGAICIGKEGLALQPLEVITQKQQAH